MYLYHYYEKEIGPFQNLSDLTKDKARDIQNAIKRSNVTFAARRFDGYLERRTELEQMTRDLFISKGGKPDRAAPHYMVVEECDWLLSWYQQGEFIRIPVKEFDTATISFSYGDLFPTFSPKVNDNKEYRKQIYTYDEILRIIDQYGLPQVWNRDGKFGPERYIEVQVWSDKPISKFYKK